MTSFTSASSGDITTTITTNPPHLMTRVQALPQELIDQIRSEVFTCTTKTKLITSHKKASYYDSHFSHTKHLTLPDTPSLFLVSKATRTQFLTSYHTTPNFSIEGICAARSWIESLDLEHEGLVEEVRVASHVYGWDKFSTDETLRKALFPCDWRTSDFARKFRCITPDELQESLS